MWIAVPEYDNYELPVLCEVINNMHELNQHHSLCTPSGYTCSRMIYSQPKYPKAAQGKIWNVAGYFLSMIPGPYLIIGCHCYTIPCM